jgi:hypothetical protein
MIAPLILRLPRHVMLKLPLSSSMALPRHATPSFFGFPDNRRPDTGFSYFARVTYAEQMLLARGTVERQRR